VAPNAWGAGGQGAQEAESDGSLEVDPTVAAAAAAADPTAAVVAAAELGAVSGAPEQGSKAAGAPTSLAAPSADKALLGPDEG